LIAAISENLMAAFFLSYSFLPLAPSRVSPHTQPRFFRHATSPRPHISSIVFNRRLWLHACFSSIERPEAIMETMLQGLVIVGGLTFSLAASLLIEELIFGQIVRTAFARRPEVPKQSREN
jgi:hypothetical protein